MAMLSINGTAAPAPSGMKITVLDVSSGMVRSASGTAVMDRVGSKCMLALSWARMSGEDLAALLGQVGDGFFEVACPDPGTGDMRTITCCAGERTMGVLRMEDGVPVWTDIEMVFTER